MGIAFRGNASTKHVPHYNDECMRTLTRGGNRHGRKCKKFQLIPTRQILEYAEEPNENILKFDHA